MSRSLICFSLRAVKRATDTSILTESGYGACLRGHGKLVADTYDAPDYTVLMFPDDLEKANEDARS